MNDHTEDKSSVTVTFIVVFLLVGLILFKGVLAFQVVGDLGQPAWDYRPVLDVPGESAYAIYDPLPFPQHVLGPEGK